MSAIFIIGMAFAYNCTSNPIYCQIVKNKPTINKDYAYKLSNHICKIVYKRKINGRIFTAILMQESGYDLKALNCKLYMSDSMLKYRVCSDFGISQIYYKTAYAYNMDIERLQNDMYYSLDMGAKVLRDFMVRYPMEDYYWTRYNASSTHKRVIYRSFVERYL